MSGATVTRISVKKPYTQPGRKTQTTVDTVMVTPETLEKWKAPPFQRPVRENEKVRDLAEEFKSNGGVWPGMVTLGVLTGDTYIIDGQHRKAAFLLSGVKEGYTDVRIHHCDTMAEMGEEFVKLNSQLVRMRPDDMLRGLEGSIEALEQIHKRCPFVGYDMIRRGPAAPIISMATTIRAWKAASSNVPSNGSAGQNAIQMAKSLQDVDCEHMISFMNEAVAAFGREPEYQRLWGTLNMTICMWLYRHTVMSQWSAQTPRLNKDQFRKCLMSLSADSKYLYWLVGRQLGERDRGPAYGRIKSIFVGRLKNDLQRNVKLPQPEWAHGG